MLKKLGELARQVATSAGQAATGHDSRPPVEQFRDVWRKVELEHNALLQRQDDLDDPRLLQRTGIPDHLQRMVLLLHREDWGLIKDSNRGNTPGAPNDNSHGPLKACLEYTLENRVFIDLCAKGLADRPRGMMTLILITVHNIIEKIRHPLLPYKTAHQPLCQLIRVSAEVGSPEAKESLICLLRTLWFKMRKDPSQLQFFYAPSPRGGAHKEQLDMFLALIPFMLEDSETGENARFAVLCASSIYDSYLHHYIVESTNFCKNLAIGLCEALKQYLEVREGNRKTRGEQKRLSRKDSNRLQKQVDEASLMLELQWQFALSLSTPGVLAALEESMAGNTQKDEVSDDFEGLRTLADAVVEEVDRVFLRGNLVHFLSETSETTATDAMLAASALMSCLGCKSYGKTLESPLAWKLLSLLISDDLEPDTRQLEELGESSEERLQVELLARIDSMSPELSIAALKLILSLLEVNDPRILNSLVMRQLHPGLHLVAADEGAQRSDMLRTPPRSTKKSVSPGRDSNSPKSAPRSGSAVEFLSKYPGSPRPPILSSNGKKRKQMSSQEQRDLIAFEAYLTDEQGRTASRIAAFTSRTATHRSVEASPAKRHPGTPPPSPAIHRESEGDFNSLTFSEGLFVMFVFNKLERMLDSSFEENLILTGILATLAQYPHRALHVYLYDEVLTNKELLNAFEGKDVTIVTEEEEDMAKNMLNVLGESSYPMLKIRDDIRSLSKILTMVWKEAQERASDLGQEFDTLRRITRIYIGVDEPDVLERAMDTFEDAGPGSSKFRFVQAYVVLEEFLKELASILQAKQNLTFLQCDLSMSQTAQEDDDETNEDDDTN